MKCNICKSFCNKLFSQKVLNRYSAQYYQCCSCNFVQTEEPFWLEEAYESPINRSDTGILKRNIILAKRTAFFLKNFRNHRSEFLDYAGGLGIFTRLMRDRGFNFYWNDPYTQPTFAKGFEKKLDHQYEAITSFESFEHFINPLDTINKILSRSDTLIFSTLLSDKIHNSELKSWWYLGPQHGQHINFFSIKTLEFIAEKFNMQLLSDYRSYHIFTRDRTPQWSIKLSLFFSKIDLDSCVRFLAHRKSLTYSDHSSLINPIR